MGQIIIPGKWNKQPQYPVELDYNNSIVIKLGALFSSIHGININLIDRYAHTLSSDARVTTYPWGVGNTVDVSAASVALNNSLFKTSLGTSNFSIFVLAAPQPISTRSFAFIPNRNDAGATSSYDSISLMFNGTMTAGVSSDSAGTLAFSIFDTSAEANTVNYEGACTGELKLFGGARESNNIYPIVNGIYGTGAANSSSIDGWDKGFINGYAPFARGIPGPLYLAGLTKPGKNLTREEWKLLAENPWQIFKPIKRQLWSQAHLLNPRYARPVTTISNTGWYASSGSNLPSMINEETPNDTNYIYSNTYAAIYESKLDNVEDPNTSNNQVVKYRTRSVYGNTLIAKLKQGSTVIATRTHTNVPSEWTTYSMILSESEANAITDYTDLRIVTEIA